MELHKAIPQIENVIKELVLPEWLNGKEGTLLNINRGNNDWNHLMETCRCFQNLYDVICSARLNLACACREDYPELLDPNNPQISHIWMRSQFVNNAILWYNAAFDLTLPPLWMYYKIYSKVKPNLRLTTENLEKILESCRYESLKKNSPKELGNDILPQLEELNTYMQGSIRHWANTLKHRRKIEYIELSKNDHPISVGGTFKIEKDEQGKTILKMNKGDYNSSDTINRIDMTEVIHTLISFHKKLVPITKEINGKIYL